MFQYQWADEIDDLLLEQIRALINRVLESEAFIGFKEPLRKGERSTFLEELRLDVGLGRRHLLVIRALDGELASIVLLSPNTQPNCRHLAEVSKCMVHPKHRGQGIIRTGLQVLLERCRALDIEVLLLDVRKGTRAEAQWRHLGFIPFGELSDYAREGGERKAGVFMWASVSELGK